LAVFFALPATANCYWGLVTGGHPVHPVILSRILDGINRINRMKRNAILLKKALDRKV